VEANNMNIAKRANLALLCTLCAAGLALAAAAAAAAAQAQAQTPLRFARIENMPDQYVGGEILKAVYGRLNLSIELVDLPARRALGESSTGALDGEVQRNINVHNQYPTLLPVHPAINVIEPSVFCKHPLPDLKGWDSIKDYNVGIVRGVGTSEDGTRGMRHVEAVTSLDQLMRVLAADRVDVSVSDAFSGLAALRKLGLQDQVRLLTPALQRNEIYHFLHEKHRDLIPRVEKVLREMQASGELEALRRRAMDGYLAQLRPDAK
jgi:ABC-type amino acid transport substrate-binding protein